MRRLIDAVAIFVAPLGIIHLVVAYLLPASLWFNPGQPLVRDAVQGECPVIVFDRDINFAFWAEWIVTIMKPGHIGPVTNLPTFPGVNEYRPGNALPEGDELNLGWWTWDYDTPCNLKPGEYIMHTSWTLSVLFGIEKQITRTSNAFTVHPKP